MLILVRHWPKGNDKLYKVSSRVLRFFRGELDKSSPR